MKREWKPGNVALVRGTIGVDAVAVRSGVPSNMGWAYNGDGPDTKNYGNCWMSDRDGDAVIRPLVVIDPEDREQIERLRDLMVGHDIHEGRPCYSTTCHADRLADALHEFANPTPLKPDEPTGLGAVVEDEKGDHWVRLDASGVWACSEDEDRTATYWPKVTAVRILSEGVQP
ncbi:hypothetical protein J2X46_002737 [Nocardioides sp. BE266]|uniref:hypothetical protein n=1 Tax=Nocardioides sp. BE266 TaxID=2817725 RepID=UPI0028562DF3|nr:hypothetical protein [Nocardioides sp. BE266]MDR7253747.1 hypothetical protein [Nocardioides sp. BE266]